MVMIRCALESPYLGQPFKYLERHYITHRKIFRATWSQKVRQKLMKTQKFRESQLALKNKILSFVRFLRLSSTSTLLNVLIWCALDSSALKQPFKFFKRQHMGISFFRGGFEVFFAIWPISSYVGVQIVRELVRLMTPIGLNKYLTNVTSPTSLKKFFTHDILMIRRQKTLIFDPPVCL